MSKDYLTQDEAKEVVPVFKPNGSFTHPESILLSALTDERLLTWQFAVQQILKAREKAKTEEILQFSVSKSLNLRATDYMGLVNFEEEEATEPPLTNGFINAELVSCDEGNILQH